MTELQNAIQTIEDQLLQGKKLRIVFEFTKSQESGEPVIDYTCDLPNANVDCDIEQASFEQAIISLANGIKARWSK